MGEKIESRIGLIILLVCFMSSLIAMPTGNKGDLSEIEKEELRIQVNELGKKCWQNRESNPDSALVYGLEALQMANEGELFNEAAKINNFVGVVYMHYMYKFKKSIPYFQKAMHLSRSVNDSLQLAYAYNNLGDVFLYTGNVTLAEQYSMESLEISQKINNDRCLSYAYINLANVNRAKGDFEKTLDLYRKASKLRSTEGESARMGYVMFDYAKTLKEAGEYEEALEYYQESLDFSITYDDYRYVSWCLNGIAGIHYYWNEYDTAISYYKRALEWNIRQNHTYGQIENHIGLALIYAKLGNKEEGQRLLDEAMIMTRQLGINSQNVKLYNGLIEFYKILGDYESATRIFDDYLVYFDSSYNSQQFEIVTEMDRGYKIEQNLLKSEQELQMNKMQRERLFVVLFVITLALIFVFRLYYLNRKKNSQLKTLNQTKDKLLSVISHDMKNSFSSILGFGELTREAIDEDEFDVAKQHAIMLERSTNDAFGLLNRLLEWSNTHNGSLHFTPKYCNLETVFKNQEKTYLDIAVRNRISLIINNLISHEVFADTALLNIIVNNLLHNAMKYTRDGGKVSLQAVNYKDGFRIIIEDNGVGIPKELLEKLNSEFKSLTSTKGVRNEKGTGLGLSIVNELVQLHKGEMLIESIEGEGTRFKLYFPKSN
jgi:signal transduction histidine kinase